MTLDEAIKYAEEVMVENLEKTKGRNASDPIATNCFKCAKEHEQLVEWLKELKQLREQTSWIPVSERLPETEERVLTLLDDGFVMIGHYIDWKDGTPITWVLDGQEDYNVDTDDTIAWMPLPKSYKEESER